MSRINGLIGRRNLLRIAGVGSFSLAASVWGLRQSMTSQTAFASSIEANIKPVNPDDALKLLVDGNRRFVEQKRTYPDQTIDRVRYVSNGQHPFACVLGCSDSRVSPEIVFDQGLGDIFDVRVAGNVATDDTIGSVEFSTLQLGCQLVVVLGHEKCGAVQAAILRVLRKTQNANKPLPGKINSVVNPILPIVASVRNQPGDITDNVVIGNVKYQVQKLQERSPILTQLIQQGKLKIVGARYDLHSGKVNILA